MSKHALKECEDEGRKQKERGKKERKEEGTRRRKIGKERTRTLLWMLTEI